MGLFRSTFSKIKKGLSRTRDVLTTDIGVLLRGQALTDELIDEIESRLLKADVGVKTTMRVVGDLRRDVKAGKITRGEGAIDFLKRELKAQWQGRSSAIATAATQADGDSRRRRQRRGQDHQRREDRQEPAR